MFVQCTLWRWIEDSITVIEHMTVISVANLFLKAISPYNMPWKDLNTFAINTTGL